MSGFPDLWIDEADLLYTESGGLVATHLETIKPDNTDGLQLYVPASRIATLERERDEARAQLAERTRERDRAIAEARAFFDEHAAVVARAESAERQVRALQDRLFMRGEMALAPCFVCGYNGPNYYQPDAHPCAARHHAALAQQEGGE